MLFVADQAICLVNIRNRERQRADGSIFRLLPSVLSVKGDRALPAPALFSFAPNEAAPRDETRQKEMSDDGQRTPNEHGAARTEQRGSMVVVCVCVWAPPGPLPTL